MTDKSKPTHPPTHPEGGGTDERRGAAQRKADEVREAEHKRLEAKAKVGEILERFYEAHRHIDACRRAYRRATGLPEELTGEPDILVELMNEVVAEREAAARRAAEETMTDESKPTHPPTHSEGGGTDERRGAAESKTDEVVREARHKYRESIAKADEIQQRLDEADKHLDACVRASRRARGFPEVMLDEADLMWEVMQEVDAQREAEEAKKNENENESKTGK